METGGEDTNICQPISHDFDDGGINSQPIVVNDSESIRTFPAPTWMTIEVQPDIKVNSSQEDLKTMNMRQSIHYFPRPKMKSNFEASNTTSDGYYTSDRSEPFHNGTGWNIPIRRTGTLYPSSTRTLQDSFRPRMYQSLRNFSNSNSQPQETTTRNVEHKFDSGTAELSNAHTSWTRAEETIRETCGNRLINHANQSRSEKCRPQLLSTTNLPLRNHPQQDSLTQTSHNGMNSFSPDSVTGFPQTAAPPSSPSVNAFRLLQSMQTSDQRQPPPRQRKGSLTRLPPKLTEDENYTMVEEQEQFQNDDDELTVTSITRRTIKKKRNPSIQERKIRNITRDDAKLITHQLKPQTISRLMKASQKSNSVTCSCSLTPQASKDSVPRIQMPTIPNADQVSGYRGVPRTAPPIQQQIPQQIPTRTFSQTNVHNLSSSMRNNWTSENNLGNYTKPLPFISSYSAHQANLRQNNGINQRRSSRHSEIGVGEIYQESVTLQPIGPGVHDLEASPTFATLPRATSHTAVNHFDRISTDSFRSNADVHLRSKNRFQDPRILRKPLATPPPSPHLNRRDHEVVAASQRVLVEQRRRFMDPLALNIDFRRSNSLGGEGQQIRSNFYSGTQSPNLQHRGFEHRSRTTRNEASQWRHVNGVASSFESINGSFAQNHVGDSLDARSSMIQVQELSHHWFRPKISRDEAQGLLINRPPGNFIVCQSRTQPEYYVLVLRVPSTANEREPVRSFFMERNQVGVGESFHLRGYASEPTYPSLVAFVHEHIKSQGALPVRLRLPKVSGETRSLLGGQSPSWRPTNGNMSTGGEFTSDVLYLASLDVFPLNDVSAVRRAVQQTLADANNPNKGLRKKCEATVQLVSSGSGSSLVITDKTGGARFTKKTIEGHRILYCGYDPEQRIFNSTELRNKGIVDSQIFGIVVKKKRFAITEHAVYVMCQLESNQPSSNLINFINQIVLGGTTQSQHRR